MTTRDILNALMFAALAGTTLVAILAIVASVERLKYWWYDLQDFFINLTDSVYDACIEYIASLIRSYIASLERAAHAAGVALGYKRGHEAGKSAGHNEGYAEGYAVGCELGEAKGYETGYAVGELEGFDKGLAKGRTILEIKDYQTVHEPRTGIDRYLFEDWRLPITAELEARVRSDVAAKLPKHKQPTLSQWKMIFSRAPATVVVAGAGSGKSTTLILRLLVLYYYLGYERDSITVVTFTNMSRWDFITKMRATFLLWDIKISIDEEKELIRTFHSMILRFVRDAGNNQRIRSFEFLGQNCRSNDDEDDEDVNPFDFDIQPTQRELLNTLYGHLYEKNERFRLLMSKLYREALSLRRDLVDSEQLEKRLRGEAYAAGRDAACVDAIEIAWRKAGMWPHAGVEPRREMIKIKNHFFQINGRILNSNIAVILGAGKYPGPEFTRPESTRLLVTELAVKRTLFQAYCEESVLWIDDPETLTEFTKWQNSNGAFAPGFDYQVKGELKAEPVLDCFVKAAGFIENLGLNVSKTVNKMQFIEDSPDATFFEALGMYWPEFMAFLNQQSPPVMTFNSMFALFGQSSAGNLLSLSNSVIRPMSHLMVDEFQDISPQIVSWVRATQREIRRRGAALHKGRKTRFGSMICVGDDAQSIYGWRGSTPKYFVDFKEEFRSPETEQVQLSENFRSHQYVIDAAEYIVAEIPSVSWKQKGVAAGVTVGQPIPVKVLTRSDYELRKLATFHYERGDSVFVLARRKADRRASKKLLNDLYEQDSRLPDDRRRLKFLTIHQSKGLEADTVFIIGDCKFLLSSPFKNQACKIASSNAEACGDTTAQHPDPLSYDVSQMDEVRRLAYVAITRAARHCYWFLDPQADADISHVKASGRISSELPCFLDVRESKYVSSGHCSA